jgi:hypothetical protein
LKTLIITALIAGLVFTGFCGTISETNSSVQAQQELLFSRSYEITTETFVSSLKHLAGVKEGESNTQMLFRFFKENDVVLEPPESVFLNEEQNKLFVRSTETHQNKIERLVLAIQNNVQPSEVH